MVPVPRGQIQLAQTGGILVVGRPDPGQTFAFDSEPFRLVDLRPVAGQWQSLIRSGDSLVIVFADGASIELFGFFNGAPGQKYVQTDDTIFFSPDSLPLAFTVLGESRASANGSSPSEGAYFVRAPEPEPIGESGLLPFLLAEVGGLVPGEAPPDAFAGDPLVPVPEPPPAPPPVVPPVPPPNNPPQLAQPIPDRSSPEDTALSFALPPGTFTDPDGDPLSHSATLGSGAPLPPWLVFDPGTQTFSGTPPQDFNGTIEVTVTASDGTDTVSDTFALDITPVNDPPIATPVDLGTVNEGGSRIVTQAELLSGVSDVDGPSLAITSLSIAAGNGALVDNLDGTWAYTPAQNDDTEVTFNYTTSDGIDTDTSTASLDITPANIIPPLLDLDGNDSSGGGSNYVSTFSMGGPAIPIGDVDITITDPDSTTIASASISLVGNGQVPPNDILSINGILPGSIVASAYNPIAGTLTLSGVASLDDYEAALRQVVFSTTDAFYNADRIISVTVNDGANTSNVAQTFMHVVSILAAFQPTDVIDLSVLLDAVFEPPDAITDYVRLVQNDTDILVQIDPDGLGTSSDWRDVAILTGYGTPGADLVNVFFDNTTHTLSV